MIRIVFFLAIGLILISCSPNELNGSIFTPLSESAKEKASAKFQSFDLNYEYIQNAVSLSREYLYNSENYKDITYQEYFDYHTMSKNEDFENNMRDAYERKYNKPYIEDSNSAKIFKVKFISKEAKERFPLIVEFFHKTDSIIFMLDK